MGMFLSVARRFGTSVVSSSIAARANAPVGASRGFATVSSPRPLSFRMDGLMAQCTIAAVLYFAPQDIVLFGGLFAYWYKSGRTVAPKAVQSDAEAALDEFKAKKGIDK